MMGTMTLIMMSFLMCESGNQNISMARFANFAFSDGSFLNRFNQRFAILSSLLSELDLCHSWLCWEFP